MSVLEARSNENSRALWRYEQDHEAFTLCLYDKSAKDKSSGRLTSGKGTRPGPVCAACTVIRSYLQ